MAHRYGDPVRVTLATKSRLPTSFTWRSMRYWVEVIGMWHLRDRRWEQQLHSDRHDFRVMTAGFQVFELYHDMVAGVWVLDVEHE